MKAVADPGFPVGGRGPRRGAMDPRGSYISKILHVKMKESGPIGGARAGRAPLDPPMESIINPKHMINFVGAVKIKTFLQYKPKI